MYPSFSIHTVGTVPCVDMLIIIKGVTILERVPPSNHARHRQNKGNEGKFEANHNLYIYIIDVIIVYYMIVQVR